MSSSLTTAETRNYVCLLPLLLLLLLQDLFFRELEKEMVKISQHVEVRGGEEGSMWRWGGGANQLACGGVWGGGT